MTLCRWVVTSGSNRSFHPWGMRHFASTFEVARCVQKGRRKPNGYQHLAEIIRGVKFVDGVKETRKAA